MKDVLEELLDVVNGKKFIVEEINLDFIDYEIYSHLNIEQDLTTNIYCESYGDHTYKGCYEQSKRILELIENKTVQSKKLSDNSIEICIDSYNFKNIENVFFNKIKIIFVLEYKKETKGFKNDIFGEYLPDSIKYDTENNKVNEFTIKLCIRKKFSDIVNKVVIQLSHELDHAFKDYMLWLNNASYTLKTIVNTKHYSDFTSQTSTNKLELPKFSISLCKDICYRLEKIEQSAYISEIVSHVKLYAEKHKTKIIDINSAIKILQTCPSYKDYKSFILALEEINNEEKEEFTAYYNKTFNKHYSSIELFEKLKKEINDLRYKINKAICKVYYNLVSENSNNTLTRDFINTINFVLEHRNFISILEEF